MRLKPKSLVALAAFFVALLWSQPAHAYIDGGTGGLIVQLLMVGLAGAGVLARLYWEKVKRFFSRAKREGDPQRRV